MESRRAIVEATCGSSAGRNFDFPGHTMAHAIRVRPDVKIPMRDGVELYAALYHPAKGTRFPVLLIRSPYGTEFPRYVSWMERFVERGACAAEIDLLRKR